VPESLIYVASERIFRFAECEFSKASRELRVGGKLVNLESKPLEILYQLFVHAGDMMTRDQLFITESLGKRVRAFELSTHAFSSRAGLTGGTAHTFASCLIELNRLDEAQRLLDKTDADAWNNWVARMIANSSSQKKRQHDYDLARAQLTPGISEPVPKPCQKAALRVACRRPPAGSPA